jgi:Ser/Thr protein kinase RdoA (MazF antagonist)
MVGGLAAEAFGLGGLSRAPEPLPGGGPALRWRVTTERGSWMVKTHEAPEARHLHGMLVSSALELAAYRAGAAMPRPVGRPDAEAGLWHRVGDTYVRAAEWVEGTPPPVNTRALGAWLGRTMATIERLDLPGDPSAEGAYVLHPMADWHRWIDAGAAAGVLDRAETAEVKATVAEATGLVEAGLRSASAAGQVFRVVHRDTNARNILLTARGPVLVDFDSAAPEVPWWEAVYQALDFARHDMPGMVHTVLDAFVEAGGARGPAEPEAFAGLVRGVLSGFAHHLRLAAGCEPATASRRAAEVQRIRPFIAGLPDVLRRIDGWVDVIG